MRTPLKLKELKQLLVDKIRRLLRNPTERDEVPRSTHQIQDRLNEITFNGALMGEMRAIDFVTRLVDSGKLSRDDYMCLSCIGLTDGL